MSGEAPENRRQRGGSLTTVLAGGLVVFAGYIAGYLWNCDVRYGIGVISGAVVHSTSHTTYATARVISRTYRWPMSAAIFYPLGWIEAKVTRKTIVLFDYDLTGSAGNRFYISLSRPRRRSARPDIQPARRARPSQPIVRV
jgi:hypothetical protein